MNTQEINNWLSLLANVGVLIGLFFLASEIQQSNRIGTNQAELTIVQLFTEINQISIDNPQLRVKLQTEGLELTEADHAQARALATQYLNTWSSIESAYQNQLVTESFYRFRLRQIPIIVDQLPGLRSEWIDIVGIEEQGQVEFVNVLRRALLEH